MYIQNFLLIRLAGKTVLAKCDGFTVKAEIDDENLRVKYLDDGNLPWYAGNSISVYYQEKYPGKHYRIYKTDPCEGIKCNETLNLPDYLWAVFKCSGKNKAEAVNQTMNKIEKEWLPQTNYEMLSKSVFQISRSINKVTDDFGEIWIPVREKN